MFACTTILDSLTNHKKTPPSSLSIKEGNGIIATFSLSTVANDWWGIKAGQQVEVTFVYLGRIYSWEKQLSQEMKDLVVPKDNSTGDIKDGPFRHFPHYATTGGLLNFEKSNLLADFTGWTILHNEEMFRKILS